MAYRDQYWELFQQTGRVEDYLAYRQTLNAATAAEDVTDDAVLYRGYNPEGLQDRR